MEGEAYAVEALSRWMMERYLSMTFDQWIDQVNAGVKARLGTQVRTEELGSDSAMWAGPNGTAVASVADDETTARLWIDGQAREEFSFRNRQPEVVGDRIAQQLSSR